MTLCLLRKISSHNGDWHKLIDMYNQLRQLYIQVHMIYALKPLPLGMRFTL